jgi:hypothetical protein
VYLNKIYNKIELNKKQYISSKMEKRIANKVNNHQIEIKEQLKIWLQNNNAIITNQNTNEDITSIFMEVIYNSSKFELTKEDLTKRKRTKNFVPIYDVCCAKKADGSGCTRRKKLNEEFCGTHIKGTPHGVINNNDINSKIEKIEVWVQQIKGINYYIDANNKVYKSEDIIENIHNPKIIAEWVFLEGEYRIPNFGI